MQDRDYLIIMNRPQAGLFSSFIQVLGELHFCRENKATPIVFFGNNWPYWNPGGYRGRINGWEYYFSPVSDCSISTVVGKDEAYLESCNIFDFDSSRIIPNRNPKHVYDLSREGHLKVPANITVVNKWPDFHLGTHSFVEENRQVAHALIEEYIHIHPDILARMEEFYAGHMINEIIVGVHIRGMERRNEIEDWHSLQYAGESAYKAEIDTFLAYNPAAKVFIATDTHETLDRFRDYYGDRCLCYPSRRSNSGESPHKEFGGAGIGEEMLIEALLLSRTDYFIHGISNVAFGVLAFNPDLLHLDIYHSARMLAATAAGVVHS
jgi:hypothetical protein